MSFNSLEQPHLGHPPTSMTHEPTAAQCGTVSSCPRDASTCWFPVLAMSPWTHLVAWALGWACLWSPALPCSLLRYCSPVHGVSLVCCGGPFSGNKYVFSRGSSVEWELHPFFW